MPWRSHYAPALAHQHGQPSQAIVGSIYPFVSASIMIRVGSIRVGSIHLCRLHPPVLDPSTCVGSIHLCRLHPPVYGAIHIMRIACQRRRLRRRPSASLPPALLSSAQPCIAAHLRRRLHPGRRSPPPPRTPASRPRACARDLLSVMVQGAPEAGDRGPADQLSRDG